MNRNVLFLFAIIVIAIATLPILFNKFAIKGKPAICRSRNAKISSNWESTVPQDDGIVTFASHSSVDRIERFKAIVKHWSGPIVLAIYENDKRLREEWRKVYCSDQVYERTTIRFFAPASEGALLYPANFMRNEAWSRVVTEYTLNADIDMIPSYGAYLAIKTRLETQDFDPKQLLVIPSFEIKSLIDKETQVSQLEQLYPKTKQELVQQVQQGRIEKFLESNFAPAYAATDHERWFQSDEVYQIEYQEYYEPYVILRTDSEVRFYPKFQGYGHNYSSWIYELAVRGYKLSVLPDCFGIHFSHVRKIYRSSTHATVLENFVNERLKTVPNPAIPATLWDKIVEDHKASSKKTPV